ncbi:MAG: hypothetical protein E6Q78_14945 [Rhodoferax sp.]|nr:MAG: hypothetical protein E6Q78_14945 [Rhodoferax sp.]
MSVINQMLRDLDQRGKSAQEAELHPGIQSVTPLPPPVAVPRRFAPTAFLVAVLALGAVAAGVAWQQGYLGVQPVATTAVPAVPVPQVVVSAPVTARPPAEADSTASAVAASLPDLLAEQPVRLRLDGQLDQLPTVSPLPVQAPAKTKAAPASAPAALPSAAVAAAPVVAAAPTPKAEKPVSATPPAPSSAATAVVVDPAVAAREALAQAQALWSAGNPAAATDLLREALQVGLRVRSGSGSSTAMDTPLLAMVRELARMQMGTGQTEAAHELLVQHEARFKGQADYWATRANAAQRLGQHADSVQSYMQALQFRPHEQRWLLGVAVSLAAMGQTAAATNMVEKARAEGPVPREIAEYLRQMGVVAR